MSLLPTSPSHKPALDGPSCRFTIPQPPSTNSLHGSHIDSKTGKQRRHNTAAYKAWIDAAGWEIKLAGTKTPASLGCLGQRLRMLIEGVEGIDIDNIKAIPDLCKTMGVIPDDNLIDELRIVRRADGMPGMVTVSIWPMQ